MFLKLLSGVEVWFFIMYLKFLYSCCLYGFMIIGRINKVLKKEFKENV